jgi:hypothetical protein
MKRKDLDRLAPPGKIKPSTSQRRRNARTFQSSPVTRNAVLLVGLFTCGDLCLGKSEGHLSSLGQRDRLPQNEPEAQHNKKLGKSSGLHERHWIPHLIASRYGLEKKLFTRRGDHPEVDPFTVAQHLQTCFFIGFQTAQDTHEVIDRFDLDTSKADQDIVALYPGALGW